MSSTPIFTLSGWVFKPIFQQAVEMGVSRQQLQHTLQELHGSFPQADERVSYTVLDSFIHEILMITGDVEFGVKLGMQQKMLSGHLLDYLVRSCDTLFKALGKIEDYNILLSDFLFVKLKEEQDKLHVRVTCLHQWAELYPESSRIIRDCVLIFMMRLVHDLSNGKINPDQVFLNKRNHNDSISHQLIHDIFREKIQNVDLDFETLVYSLSADIPLISSNKVVEQTLEKYIRNVAVPEKSECLSKAIEWQLTEIGEKMLHVTVKDIAKLNGISVRKLQYCLQEEGTSYRVIYNKVKFQMIARQLKNKYKSVKESASSLGYANASALSAFVKKYAGMSPNHILF